jgi:hypothetical protein
MAMSRGDLTVDIRAGPAMPADRSELGHFSAGEASERAAALERAGDAPETPPLCASVASGVNAREKMIPNGWFG